MEVILAKSAGFCFGVQRALDTVYGQIENAPADKKIYTYGPIIHNKEVVRNLAEKGVESINSPEEIETLENAILVIRSHGVARSVYETAEKAKVTVADATCPFVKKIHRLVSEESSAGKLVVIIGDRNHPEVMGIAGWCESEPVVIGNEEEAERFKAPEGSSIFIVAQTTFNALKFEYIVEIIRKKGYDTRAISTICNATAERQKEAEELSKTADAMIVIGDSSSSNTQKLYEICRKYCKNTYHIQTVKDLTVPDLQSRACVGITAGASTPKNIIQEVLVHVRGNYFQ